MYIITPLTLVYTTRLQPVEGSFHFFQSDGRRHQQTVDITHNNSENIHTSFTTI